MDKMQYPTEFINRSGLPKRIEDNDNLIRVLEDGESTIIKSWKRTTDWARWARATFLPKDRIELVENPDWSDPWAEEYWTVELKNESGSTGGEQVRVLMPNPAVTTALPYITAHYQIPRIIPLNPEDPLISYKELIWRSVKEKVRAEECRKYFITVTKMKVIKVLRNERDIEKIKAEKQKRAEEHAARMAQEELAASLASLPKESPDAEVHSDNERGSEL